MNWDAIGAVGELTGAVAVIGTLFYLAYQIRQNTSSVRAQSYNDMLVRQHGIIQEIYNNPDVCRVWLDGISGGTLNRVDSVRYTFLWLDLMYHFEDCYVQYKNGIVEEHVWKRQEALLSGSVGQPGFKAWWAGANSYFLPEFVDVVSSVKPMDPLHQNPETGEWVRAKEFYRDDSDAKEFGDDA
jgi:hypothetical protein